MQDQDSDQIYVPYNHDLKPLEKVLAGVRRPGGFFMRGVLETPMPRIEVKRVGVLSFPVPDSQIREVVAQADRAPYGRGEETILDASVRRAWQLEPAKVRIGGKSWERSLQQILSMAADGLGCSEIIVAAEFYKLLVYEEGGFFLPHRDTEKTGGMFGTLTIVLPSAHRGGALVLRHAGREAVAELSNPEVSELTFAAFYADCEHEVRPITRGSRVCLVYNLIQKSGGKKNRPLTAPLYDTEIGKAADLIERTFRDANGPVKLAWLLEHQYSPAGLSFAALKGQDAALAMVLRQAAERPGCAVHLGIVHIEESGAAQPFYDSYHSRGRRGYRGGYNAPDEDDDARSEDFEVVEVSDGSSYIDQWIDAEDRAVAFGPLPLGNNEILPAGSLDDEAPDQQRLTEATGNEGASFERSYHRAVMVLWARSRFVDVLLQAGPAAAIPYFNDRLGDDSGRATAEARREEAKTIASRIVDAWENQGERYYLDGDREPSRKTMIGLLARLGDPDLLERFVRGVVMREYDGSENPALAANVALLRPAIAAELLCRLAEKHAPLFPVECTDLLSRLTRQSKRKRTVEFTAALRRVGAVIVETVARLEKGTPGHWTLDWRRVGKAKPVDAALLAGLIGSLTVLDASDLRDAAYKAVAANSGVFDIAAIVVPALELLRDHDLETFSRDPGAQMLWRQAAQFLLSRSEHPPEYPKDWRQDVTISCKCADCRELQAFAFNPGEQIRGFKASQDRRQHLHAAIQRHNLDMTHVTERKGSPHTLVCTKTRETYKRHCLRHKSDLAAMATLIPLMDSRLTHTQYEGLQALSDRMNAAQRRSA